MNTFERILMNVRCRLGKHTWIRNEWADDPRATVFPGSRGDYRICATKRCRGLLYWVKPC